MGYTTVVYLTSGVSVPQEELLNVLYALTGIDLTNEPEDSESRQEFYERLLSGIPIPTSNMGAPYRLVEYNYDGRNPLWMIELNQAFLEAGSDPAKEVQLPQQFEIDLFMNFLRSKNIYLPYGDYLVAADY